MNNKNLIWIIVILAIVALGYYLYTQSSQTTIEPLPLQQETTTDNEDAMMEEEDAMMEEEGAMEDEDADDSMMMEEDGTEDSMMMEDDDAMMEGEGSMELEVEAQ